MRCSPSATCASRSSPPGATTCSPSRTTSRRCGSRWHGPFPLWQPSGPDGLGAPVLPPWYVAALHDEGGAYDAVTVREPKRRHGRDEVRMVWTLADPRVLAGAGAHGTRGEPWPHLHQVARVER